MLDVLAILWVPFAIALMAVTFVLVLGSVSDRPRPHTGQEADRGGA